MPSGAIVHCPSPRRSMRVERRDSTRSSSASRRRDSLPSTCESSTVATEAKVLRRQSLRRESLSEFKARQKELRLQQQKTRDEELKALEELPPKPDKENQGAYSPPLTRSAKKARFDSGIVLNFSPPNQEENARREKEANQRREKERLRRIQQHRDSGMLLQFSPTNRETVPRPMMIDKPSEWPDPATLTSVEVPERSLADSTNTSNLTEPHENSTNFDPNICDILEKMHGQLNEFIGRNQSAELQAQVLRVQELVAENSDLKKARNILENKIEHVMDVHAAERNDFLTQVACLSSKLEATQQSSESQLKAWDETRAILKHQVDMLAQEKENLGLKINRCENDLKDSREKLQLTTKLLEDAKKEKDLEKTLLEDKIKENELLVATIQKELIERENQCSALKRELEAAKNLSVKLQGEITTYIKEIDSMGSTVDIYKKCESDLRRQNDALQNAVNSLECELNQSKIAMINEKDSKIGELFKQLGDLQEILSRERGQWTLSLNSAEEKERNLLKQVDGLQQSLSAASDRVKDLEATNSSMEEELNDQKEEALRQLRAIDVMKLESQKIKSDLELQVGDLCKALVETTNRVNLLSAENKSLHDQLAQASIQITDRQHQYEHLESVTKSEIDRLTQELNDVCKELEETEHKYTDAQSRLKELSCENIQSQASSSATLASLDHTEQLLMAERLRCEKSEERIIDLQRQLRSVCQERDDARTNMKDFTEREEELYAKLRASEQIRREMHGKIMQLMGNIRVFVRVRPCLPGESKVERSINDCVDVFDTPFQYPQLYELRDDLVCGNHDATKNRIKVREPFKDRGGLNDRRKVWEYSFDKVFSPDHTQDDIWESTEPLVQSTIDGYNVTIFAYGQTGSGKTYTMLGEPENEGIITRSIKKLFRAKNEIEALSRGKTKVEVAVELLEVYNEKVRDLVAPNSGPRGSEIPVKVTSQEVVGNTMVQTTTEEQVFHILNLAQGRRCVKATLSNSESSRSHMIFTIHFNVCMLDGSLRRGKLNVCDLAGSERLSKSKTNEVGGSLLDETKHINKSLSTLSNVIERLQAGDKNVPFRESKLTFLLKDSLGGNSKTLAIVCCNPHVDHIQESLSSLRFATKVNRVDLKATANFSC